MKLKNRLVLYSWTHRKVNYFDPYETTTKIFIHCSDKKDENLYVGIPEYCKTPRDIEIYVKALENYKIIFNVERTDYEY